MPLAIRHAEPPATPPTYITVAAAAHLLGCSEGHLRRRCRDLAAKGLAKRIDGVWHIHANFDQRLRGITSRDEADRVALGELSAAGIRPRYIRIAEQRRDILARWSDWSGGRGNVVEQARRFCASLIAGGVIQSGEAFSPSTLFGWRQRYERGGLRALVPGYGGPRGGDAIGAEAWKFFLGVRHVGHRISVAAAWRQTLGYIIDSKLTGRTEWRWPPLRTVQQRYSHEPRPLRVYNDLGPDRFRARCLPKIARNYHDLPAGDLFVGDERTFDLMVRVPSARGWKRVRPKLTAWIDARSRLVVGWHIGESANSDTILSSFRLACERAETIPLEVIIDNGEDYQRVAGRRCRKWDAWDSERLQTAFERLKIAAHYAIIRHPWSKMIESHFRALAELDRFVIGYWGGSPDERPFDADEWTRRHLAELHTLDELRALFAQFLGAHHEQPQTGDGMFGLCPRQAYAQFFTTAPRRVTPETLRAICSHLVGPVRVGRDGVRWNNELYGQFDEQVWRLQGRDVHLLVDADDAGFVTVCDAEGTPICRAAARRLRGVSRDEVRAAERQRRQMEKIARQYAGEARAYLLRSTPQQIIHRRRLAAVATQTPDASLPPPPAVEQVRMVAPRAEAAVERIRRASGAEAIRRLADCNAGAAAINAGALRHIDYGRFANDRADESEPARRVVDFARFSTEDNEDSSHGSTG